MIRGFKEAVSPEVLRETPAAFIQYCQHRCVTHAVDLSRLFGEVHKLSTERYLTDPSVAICVYQCTKILSHAYKDDYYMEPEVDKTEVLRLVKIFPDFLYKLGSLFPNVDVIRQDIMKIIERMETQQENHSVVSTYLESTTISPSPQPQQHTSPRQMLSKHSILEGINRTTGEDGEIEAPSPNAQTSSHELPSCDSPAQPSTENSINSQSQDVAMEREINVHMFGDYDEFDFSAMLGIQASESGGLFDHLLDPFARMQDDWPSVGLPVT